MDRAAQAGQGACRMMVAVQRGQRAGPQRFQGCRYETRRAIERRKSDEEAGFAGIEVL